MHRDFALMLAFLVVAVPWLGKRQVRQLMEAARTTKMDRLALYASTMAFQWLAAGVVLWRTSMHGIPPPELGLSIPNVPLIVAVSAGLCALIFANQILSLRRMAARPAELKGILPQLVRKVFPQDDIERLVFLALVVTVAVCEEFIYRGFVQRILGDWLGGSIAAGILVSAIFFAWAHLYQGRRGLVSTFAVGLLFSAIRAWTGSLVPPLAAHFVADLTVGFLAPYYLRAALASAASPEGSAREGQGMDP